MIKKGENKERMESMESSEVSEVVVVEGNMVIPGSQQRRITGTVKTFRKERDLVKKMRNYKNK